MSWRVPQIWPAANVVIIGGGPSFKLIPQSELRELSIAGKIKVIGVNKAYKEIPDSNDWMHVMWFGDAPFYVVFKTAKEGNLYTFKGLRVTCSGRAAGDPAIKYVDKARGKEHHGICTDPRRIRWNRDSGGSAINLAYHFTGREGRVFLFGFDMKGGPNHETHWHDGYKKEKRFAPVESKQPYYNRSLKHFRTIGKVAGGLGFKIYNVNLDSAIPDFPKITFEQFKEMVTNG